ncbi:helix-turn-helix domain-containing protein [Trinickia diaoshuihuensis]|jgi:transcriptional regulator with XRE-family HTH domain|uniref:helix-turn-helix domain-containing protein n=1 Tax=Trinickia diaoshuihuensis TaxID=2292265 RepID=UPI000E234516|nr:XRE family transcriptional regulator [Trinickia diaoshuihuensis]
MNVHDTIARRVRELRDAKGWSLDALAERSKVSRSNISLIERGQSSPTAIVLDKLAMAFGVSLAALFEPTEQVAIAEPSPHCSRHEQLQWTDPESGYVRRNLSPPAWSPIQLVEVQFPPGKQVAYETGLRDADIHQQVWIIDGAMEVTVGERQWRLEAGDCLAMKLDCPIVFRNTSRKNARYLVALSKPSSNESRSHS